MKAKLKTKLAKVGAALASTAGLVCSFPALAFAAEEESSSSSGGIEVLIPDMNEFIPMLVVFIILFIVLAKWGWPVVNNILVKRDTAIKDSLEKAEQSRVESEELLEQYKQQLADAHEQAEGIIAEAKRTAENARDSITQKAQEEADAMIEKARQSIELEKRAAIAELKGIVVDTSVEVTSRLVREDLTDEDHRRIIEQYVNEAGSFNAN